MRHGRKTGDKIWLTGSETFFFRRRDPADTMIPGEPCILEGEPPASRVWWIEYSGGRASGEPRCWNRVFWRASLRRAVILRRYPLCNLRLGRSLALHSEGAAQRGGRASGEPSLVDRVFGGQASGEPSSFGDIRFAIYGSGGASPSNGKEPARAEPRPPTERNRLGRSLALQRNNAARAEPRPPFGASPSNLPSY